MLQTLNSEGEPNMEKKHYYLIVVQFANPNPPSFIEPWVYDVIRQAIDFYNQKSLIVANPKRIIDHKIIDKYTLELKLESSSELALPSKALRVFSKFLVDDGTLTPYIYGKALFKMSTEEINYVAENKSIALSLGQNNIDNRKEKHMKTKDDLLHNKIESLFDDNDGVDSILRAFLVDLKMGDRELGLENKFFNEGVYRLLEWNNNEYFDIVNSFYSTFVCGLTAYANSIEHISQYWSERAEEHKLHDKKYIGYIKSWNQPPFRLGGLFTKDFSEITREDTALEYLTQKENVKCYSHISKETFAAKVLNSKNILFDILADFKSTDNGRLINELSELIYCVGNFMPCPSSDFNAAKGSSAHDYLPVFINLIQYSIDNNKSLHYGNNQNIEPDRLVVWQKWLIDNVDKYCLGCFYKIEKCDNKLRLAGIPLFKGQTLEHPFPETAKEVQECIRNSIDRINKRAEELLCRIQGT